MPRLHSVTTDATLPLTHPFVDSLFVSHPFQKGSTVDYLKPDVTAIMSRQTIPKWQQTKLTNKFWAPH